METIRVLIVDTTDTLKRYFETNRATSDSTNFVFTVIAPQPEHEGLDGIVDRVDAIVFGDKLSPSAIIQFTRFFRSRGVSATILVLTNRRDRAVPRNFQQAGVDDMLGVSEMSTPLFSWTFISLLRQAEVKKKAKEYDVLCERLKGGSESLAVIIHELNNPLSVIRLALYHLENPALPDERKQTLFKMLTESVDRLGTQIDELRTVRRKLSHSFGNPAKLTSSKINKSARA